MLFSKDKSLSFLHEVVGKSFVEKEIDETNVAPKPGKSKIFADFSDEEGLDEDTLEVDEESDSTVWGVFGNGSAFTPIEKTTPTLFKGVYTGTVDMSGKPWLLRQKEIISDEYVDFTDEVFTKLTDEIDSFWKLKDQFLNNGFIHKRGILLFGPPGGGKTVTIVKTIRKINEMGGIAYIGGSPNLDMHCISAIRTVQPEVPIVVVYEDIDDTIDWYGDRVLTRLLDGENNVNNVLYLATTNYPERLPSRILRRPSRFDVVQLLGYPNLKTRYEYFAAKKEKFDLSPSEVQKMAEVTKGFSFPYLKELLILNKVYNIGVEDSAQRLTIALKGRVLGSDTFQAMNPDD